MIRRRIARLESSDPRQRRPFVVRIANGETSAEAIARAGVTWPVAVLPLQCGTVEEWLDRHAPLGEASA